METILEGQRVFDEGARQMAVGWQIWMYWMIFVNLVAALPFAFTRNEARFIIVAFILAETFMMWLAGTYGFAKILGLAHIVFWSPLLIYLVARYRSGGVPRSSFYGRYVLTVILTNGVSLIIDAVDVVRYLLGEQSGS